MSIPAPKPHAAVRALPRRQRPLQIRTCIRERDTAVHPLPFPIALFPIRICRVCICDFLDEQAPDALFQPLDPLLQACDGGEGVVRGVDGVGGGFAAGGGGRDAVEVRVRCDVAALGPSGGGMSGSAGCWTGGAGG